MKWKHRFGLMLIHIVLYAMLTKILPASTTDLQRGVLHIGFIIGYSLFLVSDGED